MTSAGAGAGAGRVVAGLFRLAFLGQCFFGLRRGRRRGRGSPWAPGQRSAPWCAGRDRDGFTTGSGVLGAWAWTGLDEPVSLQRELGGTTMLDGIVLYVY